MGLAGMADASGFAHAGERSGAARQRNHPDLSRQRRDENRLEDPVGQRESGYGLLIDNAWFKRGPKDPWMQVLGDARLSEMFVPYYSGSPRFWDVSYNFALVTMTKEDAGAFGKLLGDPPIAVQEIRDRGVMWIDPSARPRRGPKPQLWRRAERRQLSLHHRVRLPG